MRAYATRHLLLDAAPDTFTRFARWRRLYARRYEHAYVAQNSDCYVHTSSNPATPYATLPAVSHCLRYYVSADMPLMLRYFADAMIFQSIIAHTMPSFAACPLSMPDAATPAFAITVARH